LVQAGLTGIYLSFDGLTSSVYEKTCGADLLDAKLKVIGRCREAGIQVVLAMTVICGLNDDQIGSMLTFCLENSDVIAGLALQPAFTSGRFDVKRNAPYTMGDVIFDLQRQSGGLLGAYDLWPLGTSHPLCSVGTFLVPADKSGHPSGFFPATRALTREIYIDEFNPSSPQGSVFADILASEGYSTSKGLSLIVMNYMDAQTMDIERLKQCSMMVVTPEGRSIPFCSYHLTDLEGNRIYYPWDSGTSLESFSKVRRTCSA
ncbi:MAG: hypothetical protein LUB61_04640, partial [Eggerthellaceae bacterium]|nr:hypothetical protein [Eggerthellaceae bacterium]